MQHTAGFPNPKNAEPRGFRHAFCGVGQPGGRIPAAITALELETLRCAPPLRCPQPPRRTITTSGIPPHLMQSLSRPRIGLCCRGQLQQPLRPLRPHAPCAPPAAGSPAGLGLGKTRTLRPQPRCNRPRRSPAGPGGLEACLLGADCVHSPISFRTQCRAFGSWIETTALPPLRDVRGCKLPLLALACRGATSRCCAPFVPALQAAIVARGGA